jgi:hypothetical protein
MIDQDIRAKSRGQSTKRMAEGGRQSAKVTGIRRNIILSSKLTANRKSLLAGENEN